MKFSGLLIPYNYQWFKIKKETEFGIISKRESKKYIIN